MHIWGEQYGRDTSMVIRDYPEEIKKLMAIYKLYRSRIENGVLKDAPPKVIEAFEKVKKWAWEQGQQIRFYFKRNIVVSLSALPSSRDFH